MAVLTAFAISQPIFDLLARHPPFLVAHGVTGEDTLDLVLILAVGLPLMVGLVFLAGLVTPVSQADLVGQVDQVSLGTLVALVTCSPWAHEHPAMLVTLPSPVNIVSTHPAFSGEYS